jgi:hypothetical protein
MKPIKNPFLTALALAALSAGAWAQNAEAPVPASSTVTAADVQTLKDALAAQQKQIDRLTQLLQRQADGAQLQTVSQQQPAEFKNAVLVQQGGSAATSMVMQSPPADSAPNPMHGPTSIYFKGITITPGGFAESAFVRRSRALGADLPTPFNSLTMPGASQSSLSEFFGSARQSRPTMYIDGRMKNVAFSSYMSGDFLSAGTSSTATQTNSYTFRLRQVWGQAKFDNGWSFLGGQAWSLVTENKEGIAPSDDTGRTNDARPMVIDPSYNVGFSFARQYGIRVTKDFNHKLAFAVAMENPQATVTTHGNTDNFLLGSAGASNSYNSAITGCSLLPPNTTATGSGNYGISCSPAGTYSFNPSPDIVAKVAIDPGFGHYEVFGLFDRFRDRVFPCADFIFGTASKQPCTNGASGSGPSAADAYNASKNGGGIGANARWHFYDNHVTFGLHFFGGSGVGRYGASQLPDLAIHANGTPLLLKNDQGLASLEWHGKKLDVYFYSGAEYDGRGYDFDNNTLTYVGYGSPYFKNSGCNTEAPPSYGVSAGFNPGSLSSCTADTRAAIEGTAGFWYRFYSGPRGRFQFGTQYSYVTRQTWGGTSSAGVPGAASPEGLDGMIFTSFRYYLP